VYLSVVWLAVEQQESFEGTLLGENLERVQKLNPINQHITELP